MATTKQYLDLNGLKYLLSKLSYTKAAEKGKFLTGIAEKNGVISVTSASLTTSDIPKLGTPTAYTITTSVSGNNASIHSTITRDAGEALTANILLGVSGDLTLARDNQSGALTIGYAEKVKGVKADGYLTLDSSTKLLDINAAKIQGNAGGTKGLLAAKEYVDEKVAEAIAGGVQYKGTVETNLPPSPANGDMYKVTKDIEATPGFAGAKAGDVIIYHTAGTPGWDVIPAGDDVEYTGIKVGDTYIINPTSTGGGDATFAAGEGLSVAGKGKTVTYSHAVSTGAAETTSGFYKIATDKFGHVTGTVAVAKEDITGLLGDYVSTIGGKSGVITLKSGYTAEANPGSINLTMVDNELQAAIVGLGTAAYKDEDYFAKAAHKHEIADVTGLQDELNGKQAKFTDGTATIASEANGVVTLNTGIAQDHGKIANSGADITLAKVATTGAAVDVTYDKGTTELAATNVQGAITELAGKVKDVEANAGVTSFGGQKGAITVNTTGTENGSINFTVGTDKVLKGTVAGWATKQDAFQDGTAKIVGAISANVGYEAYTAAATAETATIYATVAQNKGAIKDGSADGLTISNITKAEIDTLFA